MSDIEKAQSKYIGKGNPPFDYDAWRVSPFGPDYKHQKTSGPKGRGAKKRKSQKAAEKKKRMEEHKKHRMDIDLRKKKESSMDVWA